ncbi:MAG: dihydropteroate synthase, partial [Nitrososphaerota archaeon]|nr:dihydropteroate synthase [Nitrososphaerota archaeon]
HGWLAASKRCSVILTAHESRKHMIHDPIKRISSCLEKSIERAVNEGVGLEQITIDPGIGFFSDSRLTNVDWNCNTISRLEEFRSFQRPICIGVSRKRFIGSILGEKSPDFRLNGSLAASAISVYNGAHIVRTHDVRETLEVIRVAEAIREKSLIHQALGKSA